MNDSIYHSLESRSDIFYLFLNTPRFINHPRVLHLDSTNDDSLINRYLYACDAMLHARWEGETFGLACAEFLIRSKPILTWSESRERNHFLLADNSVIL